jgi:hypothetical protein
VPFGIERGSSSTLTVALQSGPFAAAQSLALVLGAAQEEANVQVGLQEGSRGDNQVSAGAAAGGVCWRKLVKQVPEPSTAVHGCTGKHTDAAHILHCSALCLPLPHFPVQYCTSCIVHHAAHNYYYCWCRTFEAALQQQLQLHMLPAAEHAKRLRAKVRVDSGLGTGRQLHARLQFVG